MAGVKFMVIYPLLSPPEKSRSFWSLKSRRLPFSVRVGAVRFLGFGQCGCERPTGLLAQQSACASL
jgi:hypothetical protein